MKFKISEIWLEEVRDGYYSLQRKHATREELGAYIAQKAEYCGRSVKTLYNRLALGARTVSLPKEKAEEFVKKWEEIDIYAQLVFDLASTKSRDEARIDWSIAYKALRRDGQIPEHVKLGDIYKSISRLNLLTKSEAVMKHTVRNHALSLVHVDYSVSRYFKYDPRDNSLVLTPPGEGYYKGSPEKPLRVWFAVIRDQRSGVIFAQYVLAKGESPEMTQLFLLNAFAEKNRIVSAATGECVSEELYQGMPTAIYWDRGPGHKTLTVKGLTELGIQVITGNNKFDGFGKKTHRSNKQAHGAIESQIKLVKRHFEAMYHLRFAKGWKISLDKLNDELRTWTREKNLGAHPTEKTSRCWDIFEPALEGMRYPPDNFMEFFAGIYHRKVQHRLIEFRGEQFVAPDLARNGETIGIMEDGDSLYAIVSGKRYLLERQNEWHIAQHAPRELASDALLADRELRLLLDEEIKQKSAGELYLGMMKQTHEDDLAAFYEKPHTADEIREFAALLVRERSSFAPNIIRMPQPGDEDFSH